MENKNLYEVKKRNLLDYLIKQKYLRDQRLFEAFLEVPLEEFIPKEFADPRKIYEDIPNLFYYEKPENYRTISAPHMISIMLQGLALKEDDDLLILGAKSGYIAALAHKLAPKGEIIILEANSEIAKITVDNLKKLNLHDNITVNIKNPLEGMPDLSPWQKILVTGAIKQERIHPLLKQLDTNEGVLYAPIGEEFIQTYTQILRVNDEFYGKKQLQVRFTPLMTQVEIDELELITDFEQLEELEIKDDPNRVDQTLSKLNEKISIKYASSILDEVEFKPRSELHISKKKISDENREEVLNNLENIDIIIIKLKKEDDINNCFDFVEDIETQLENLNKFKKEFDIKTKKIQNLLNQIRTCNIVRKELRKEDFSKSTLIDKDMEVINKQIETMNELHDLIINEIERIKNL
ncbi:MAG: protein-L-isoaspartate O-methyltransferase [Promethearchaeota archaeon]